jgi:chitin disaccharide deacetylase
MTAPVSEAAPIIRSPSSQSEPQSGQRLRNLWLCADDYGISPAVNRGIRDLIARGRINATSVMVTAPSFSATEAATLAATLATLDGPGRGAAIGLHFTLTAPFRPSTPAYRPVGPDGDFPSLPRMLAAGLLGRLDSGALTAEAASQFDAFRTAFGRPPDFVDGHQHVHLLPQVGDALLDLMPAAAPAAWIRQCGRASRLSARWGDPKGLLLDVLSRRLRARSAACGVPTNPAFAGTYNFAHARGYDTLFASFLDGLPDGGLVMCHPGFVDAELQRLDSLIAMREQEYSFFAGERFPQLLASKGFVLTTVAPRRGPE